MTLVVPTLFETKKYSSQQQLVMEEIKHINFKSNRTSSMFEKMQTKQLLLSSKVSSSHQIPSYHNNATSKLNEYINKLTLPYLNSFCQPFHIPFFYNIFDQRLFCCYEKLFQPVHKRVINFFNDITISTNINDK